MRGQWHGSGLSIIVIIIIGNYDIFTDCLEALYLLRAVCILLYRRQQQCTNFIVNLTGAKFFLMWILITLGADGQLLVPVTVVFTCAIYQVFSH